MTRPTELLFIRPRGEGLSETLDQLEELLVAEIPESIRSLSLEEPVYCVAITYCGEQFFWPTTMYVGTESLRSRLREDENAEHRFKALVPDAWGEPRLRARLWSPAAHERASELQLRALQLIDSPNVLLEGELLRPARELLQRVAARLMRIDWTPIVQVTDDFIVYAMDDSGDFDASEDIRASVPAERVALWKVQGYAWL